MSSDFYLRHEEYERSYDYTIMKRVPIIIRAEIRNYKKLSQNFKKPYCSEFHEVMANAMLYTITEIQDAVFGYQHNGEMTFVLRNDKEFDYEPWNQNNIQKIVSVVSSLLTLGFYKSVELFGEDLNISGAGIFRVKVFAVPYLTEAINNLILRQQECIRLAISAAAIKELGDKLGVKTAMRILQDSNRDEKKDLLLHHCGIDFDEYYPNSFTKGIATYKVPFLVETIVGTL